MSRARPLPRITPLPRRRNRSHNPNPLISPATAASLAHVLATRSFNPTWARNLAALLPSPLSDTRLAAAVSSLPDPDLALALLSWSHSHHHHDALPTPLAHSALLRLLARSRRFDAVDATLQAMSLAGAAPTRVCLGELVAAYADAGMDRKATKMCERVREQYGSLPEVTHCNRLLTLLVEQRRWDDARKLYDEMLAGEGGADNCSTCVLVRGLCMEGRVEEGRKLIEARWGARLLLPRLGLPDPQPICLRLARSTAMAMDLDEPLDAEKCEAALQRLRDADPALYLSPSADLAAAARAASKHLHSSLALFSPTKPPPLPSLLAGPAFDAEQIWSQIELISRPILPHLRRQLRRLEHQPPSQPATPPPSKPADAQEEESDDEKDGEGDELEEELEELDDKEELDSEDDDDEEEETQGLEGRAGNRVEDKFLKIKELEEFLEKGEDGEYAGGAKRGGKKKATKNWMEEESEDEEDGDEDDDHLDLEDFEDDDEEDAGKTGGDVMYEEFFEKGHDQRVKKRDGSKKKVQFKDESHEIEVYDSENDDGNDEQVLSTHEKERLKMRAKIEQMEKTNLEPSTWTMQGEVTASSRPINSALEVDLDFEHNVKPAPVITEEVTASLEEMINKRIAEGHFDDVEKPPPLPYKAPKEQKELDESKSKKGLAELYEEDYAQMAGLAPAPLSISDELKKEANTLFKRICLKLDALSHFHFAPKPVIEDMSIQANVPALAMEEIAPVAVSDAAMLAPEEIFEGKGDVKEEAELTQTERKRRRANKKRRYAGSHKERPTKMQKD